MAPLIAGTVVDRSGAPVPAATVYFAGGPVAMPDVALLTGADGTFVLSVPVSGTYTIGVRAGEKTEEVVVNISSSGEAGLRVQV